MPHLALAPLLSPDRIVDLEATAKRSALDELVGVIAEAPQITDRDDFLKAIVAREEIMSTGIGLGVALPHAKIASVTDYVLAMGRCRNGIEFDSLDGEPVRLIILIGASERQFKDFVRLLARVTLLVRNPARRQAILDAEGPEEILQILRDYDAA
jgi:mannitol/fructose-specific phosphotransferase system IIA component (Ntr-type)